jgi:hypothetical protein
MKYKGMLMSFSFSVLLALFIFSTAGRVYPFGFSADQRETVNLQSYVISDFGDEKDRTNNTIWKARFSRYAKPTDPMQELSPPDPKACALNYVEARPLGLPQEMDAKQKYALGIKAEFIKKGYNWIEILPVKASNSIVGSDGKPNEAVEGTPMPIELAGIVKSLDMWVWGGNYKYWLEFYLQDYKGFLHRLPAGDIAFIGWRNMRTKVPDDIPQAEVHVPFLKSLKLQMVKLWAYPTERVDQFYCYFDYMQVQTDVYQERFNGDDLANSRW